VLCHTSQHCHRVRDVLPLNGEVRVLVTIIAGIVAGFPAGRIMKGSGYGILMDLVLGLVDGLIGGLIVNALGLGASAGINLVDRRRHARCRDPRLAGAPH